LAARQEVRGAESERVFNAGKYSYGCTTWRASATSCRRSWTRRWTSSWCFDSERRFLSVNDAACRFYGRTREQLIGSRLDDLIGTERAAADWDGFLTPERIAQGTLEHVWEGEQDGQRRVLEVRSRTTSTTC
jgi:PAS domain S-box-containing protein